MPGFPTQFAGTHTPGERVTLHSPEDVELFFDAGEVFVAGGERGERKGRRTWFGGQRRGRSTLRPYKSSGAGRDAGVPRGPKAERAPRVEAGRPFCIFVK